MCHLNAELCLPPPTRSVNPVTSNHPPWALDPGPLPCTTYDEAVC